MSFGSSPFNFTPNNDLNNNFNSNFSNMVNEDVLTTVTNFSVVGGNNKGIHIENNNVNKKENDKKKWLKRI